MLLSRDAKVSECETIFFFCFFLGVCVFTHTIQYVMLHPHVFRRATCFTSTVVGVLSAGLRAKQASALFNISESRVRSCVQEPSKQLWLLIAGWFELRGSNRSVPPTPRCHESWGVCQRARCSSLCCSPETPKCLSTSVKQYFFFFFGCVCFHPYHTVCNASPTRVQTRDVLHLNRSGGAACRSPRQTGFGPVQYF